MHEHTQIQHTVRTGIMLLHIIQVSPSVTMLQNT